GFITRKELTWARRVQAVGVIRSILSWNAGSYTMVADYLPKREEGTLFPLPQVVVEVIVTDQDRTRYEQILDGGRAVFEKAPGFDEQFATLGLNDDAVQISDLVGDRSAAEIAAATGKDDFNVYKLLHALAVLGLLQRRADRAETEEASPAFAGFEPEAPPADEGVWQTADESGFRFEDTPIESDTPSVVEEQAEVLSAEPEPVDLPPPPIEPAAPALPTKEVEKDSWGFDEAQVETAARGIAPPPPGAARNRRETDALRPEPAPLRGSMERTPRSTAPVAIALVLLLAVAVAAWLWWRGRDQSAATAPQARTQVATSTAGEPAVTAGTATQPATETRGGDARSVPETSPAPAGVPPAVAPTATAASSTAVARPPAGDDRYLAMAKDFAETATGNFTVQFELVCRSASLEKAIRAGGAKVWFVPTSYRGQTCYRVFWGSYPTREAAAAATREIPGVLRGTKPVVVAVPKS
ncbi:MAG TPA: hypothetical protein VFL80_02865, partial [Thermoanaerobaculia bacterium]|nr:hypothetical protein [Thermoanaerobaculia bacterium]